MKIFQRITLPLTVSVFVLGLSSAEAEQHYYHPTMNIELGKSYDAFRPGLDLRPNGYFIWTENGYKQEEGLSEVRFDYEEADSLEQVYEALKLDLNAEAKFGMSKGKVSFATSDSMELDKRTFSIVIRAYREFKEQTKNGDVRLSPTALTHLEDVREKPHLWRQVAGSEVVTSVVKGSSISAIYKFRASTISKKNELKSSLSTEWSSGKADANLLKTAQKVDSGYSVSVTYVRNGGSESTAEIQAILDTNPGDIARIKKAFSQSLEGLTKENAKVLYFKTYEVDSIPQVVNITGGKMSETATHFVSVRKAMAEHYRRLGVVATRLRLVNELLDTKGENSFVAGGKANLEVTRSLLEKTQSDILAEYAGYDLVDPHKARISTVAGQSIPVLTPTKYFRTPYVKLAKWEASPLSAIRGGTKIDTEFHDFYQSFYPVLEFLQRSFVSRIRLIKDCSAVAILREPEITNAILNGGSTAGTYLSAHKSEGIYTHGHNVLPQLSDQAKIQFRTAESAKDYWIEIADITDLVHYVHIGNIVKPRNEAAEKIPNCNEV